MSSSQASSRSPGEEHYYTAEEDHHSTAHSSSEASSTITTNPNGSSDSEYATANQTPIASPDMNKVTASLTEYPISVRMPEKEEDALGKLAFLMSLSAKQGPVVMLDRYCDETFILLVLL